MVDQHAQRHAKILFACTHVLFNLAANLTVEEKMIRRGLVSLLLPLLGHAWLELVLLAARFLAKLSLYQENIAQVNTQAGRRKGSTVCTNDRTVLTPPLFSHRCAPATPRRASCRGFPAAATTP